MSETLPMQVVIVRVGADYRADLPLRMTDRSHP